jgi:hypothetical protein
MHQQDRLTDSLSLCDEASALLQAAAISSPSSVTFLHMERATHSAIRAHITARMGDHSTAKELINSAQSYFDSFSFKNTETASTKSNLGSTKNAGTLDVAREILAWMGENLTEDIAIVVDAARLYAAKSKMKIDGGVSGSAEGVDVKQSSAKGKAVRATTPPTATSKSCTDASKSHVLAQLESSNPSCVYTQRFIAWICDMRASVLNLAGDHASAKEALHSALTACPVGDVMMHASLSARFHASGCLPAAAPNTACAVIRTSKSDNVSSGGTKTGITKREPKEAGSSKNRSSGGVVGKAADNLEALKVNELKEMLENLQLPTAGKKADLIARIRAADADNDMDITDSDSDSECSQATPPASTQGPTSGQHMPFISSQPSNNLTAIWEVCHPSGPPATIRKMGRTLSRSCLEKGDARSAAYYLCASVGVLARQQMLGAVQEKLQRLQVCCIMCNLCLGGVCMCVCARQQLIDTVQEKLHTLQIMFVRPMCVSLCLIGIHQLPHAVQHKLHTLQVCRTILCI